MITERVIAPVRTVIPKIELSAKNRVITAISVGNLPLQGMKLFVAIAIRRSLFEPIILHHVTPTQLQPSPIHIVRACFPQVLHLWNALSRLEAILGKKPRSSKKVKRGKNIAIGGSITEIILNKIPRIPSVIADVT